MNERQYNTAAHKKNRENMKRNIAKSEVSYVIDGSMYSNFDEVLSAAKNRGFDGSGGTLYKRIKKGENTWDVLSRTVDKARQIRSLTVQKKKHDEMTEILAALDARKSTAKESK